jgi:hypothetical protein
MYEVNIEDVRHFVDSNIGIFHNGKLEAIKKLKLDDLIKRKNPYLFKAKNINTAEGFVRNLLDAFLSSQEETMFGNFLEKLAIFACEKAFSGQKTPATGIDLDFRRDGVRYLVAVKSGPNWGNSSQIAKMKLDFKKAQKIIAQTDTTQIVFVNGCCYGKDKNENKGDYFKKCGQSFWEFISGREEFYKEIVEPIGVKAKERNDEFKLEYSKVINLFVKEFLGSYCKENGEINWDKIVEFNSGIVK